MSLALLILLTHIKILYHWKNNEILQWSKLVAIFKLKQYRYSMVANITNENERLHHFRFPDSGGPPDFVLPGNVESASVSNVAYRESFSESKRKSRAFKLTKLTLTRTFQSLPQSSRENRMILVESFAIRGRMDVGNSSITGC